VVTAAPDGVTAAAPLRVVFFGTPEFAAPTLGHLLASRHTVVGVVTQPDRPRGRGHKVTESPVKALALKHGAPVIQPDRLRAPEVAETLRGWNADVGVVAAYGKIIPEDLLSIPRLGMINVHASLLPKYRGAAPVHRAVIDGERETGVTIMRVEKLLDAGPMLAKATRPIGPDETSDVVERDLAERGAALLVEVLDRLSAGEATQELQDFMLCTYAPKLTKDEGLIDWNLPAIFIHNRVRGLYPWPHAYTYLDGRRLIVLKTHATSGSTDAEPGTVLDTSDGIQVATGHGERLVIELLQPEGKRPMTAREFLAGHPISVGARLSGP
jgi:methionyl-tRNA formyltransferase